MPRENVVDIISVRRTFNAPETIYRDGRHWALVNLPGIDESARYAPIDQVMAICLPQVATFDPKARTFRVEVKTAFEAGFGEWNEWHNGAAGFYPLFHYCLEQGWKGNAHYKGRKENGTERLAFSHPDGLDWMEETLSQIEAADPEKGLSFLQMRCSWVGRDSFLERGLGNVLGRLFPDGLPLYRANRPPVFRYTGNCWYSGYDTHNGVRLVDASPAGEKIAGDEIAHELTSGEYGMIQFLFPQKQERRDHRLVVNYQPAIISWDGEMTLAVGVIRGDQIPEYRGDLMVGRFGLTIDK